jgi:hypothetical protein
MFVMGICFTNACKGIQRWEYASNLASTSAIFGLDCNVLNRYSSPFLNLIFLFVYTWT